VFCLKVRECTAAAGWAVRCYTATLSGVIKDERSTFWGGTGGVIMSSYEHVSKCEWLPTESCLDLPIYKSIANKNELVTVYLILILN
jgi:hypothetical protein